MVLRHGFSIMTRFTKRLPVALIPEEFLVSSMRSDMIHHCCRCNLSFRLTPHAKRMCFQKTNPSFIPTGVVTFSLCRLHLKRVNTLVILAVLRTIRNKLWTVWKFAGLSGSSRHGLPPLYILSHLNHITIIRAKQYRLSAVLVPG